MALPQLADDKCSHSGRSTQLDGLADLMIDYITDYFTLGSFARTCKAFYIAVKARPRARNDLFDVVEETERNFNYRHTYLEYQPSGVHSALLCAKINEELINPWYFDLSVYVTGAGRQMRIINEQLDSTDLTLWGKFCYREVIEALLLPCYGCKKFKHRNWFFDHHKSAHLVLLGCEHSRRRCADCAVNSLSQEGEDPKTYSILGDSRRFLVDMPKGFPGFREWCQRCGQTRWIRQRPKKTRETRQVCEDCFESGHSAAKAQNPNLRKQRSSQHIRKGSKDESVMSEKKQDDNASLSVEITARARALSFDLLLPDVAG